MNAVRIALGLAGIALAYIGVRDLLGFDWSRLVSVLEWLIAGNVLHDVILAPLVVAAGVVLVRTLPAWARQPVVTGLVVIGVMTLVAVPVLGNFGNEATNPSLMPRNYWAGWFGFVALVIVAVAVGCWWNRRGAAGRDVERHTVGSEERSPEGGRG
jgi:hypothetical protein